jgi:hypothetical protein
MDLKKFYESLSIKSDKGTWHDYINGYYTHEFSDKRDKKIKLLEIGVGQGHSIYLWKHFFINGKILGIENNRELVSQFINDECISWIDNDASSATIKFYDAYSDACVDQFNNDEFDYIIDDGPHTLSTQTIFIQKYIQKVKSKGKLIIEDIQSEHDLYSLIDIAASMDLEYKEFDLRANSGRYDDIILEIIKK